MSKRACVWCIHPRCVLFKPRSVGNVFQVLIGWFVCAAFTTEMCLGIWVDGCVCGSQAARPTVGAGRALTASRLPAWQQNRWMPLIITVCNTLNSITSTGPAPTAPRLSCLLATGALGESLPGIVSINDWEIIVLFSRRTAISSHG